MKNDKDTLQFNKIEVDEKTQEPKIVQISEQKFEKELSAAEPTERTISEPETPMHESGKQIVMTKLLGINEKQESVNKRQKIFKNVCTALFIVLVVGVLVFTFLNDFILGDHEEAAPGELKNTLSSCWFYLIFALLSLFFCFFFKGLKLTLMCKSLTKKWHFRTCMETAIVGLYYNNVTPLAVGGQPFEIYHLSKHGVHGGVAASLPIATYFLGQIAFVILGIAAVVCFNLNAFHTQAELVAIFPTTFTVLAAIGLFFCLLMPILVLTFSIFPKIGSAMVKFVMKIGGKLRIIKNPEETTKKTIENVIHNSKCLKQIATSPVVFILSVILSFCEHLALSSIAYFTLRFFGFDFVGVNGFLEWVQIVQICLLLYAAISFIPTPGNSGAADLSFYLLFSYGITMKGGAFSAMVVWRILAFYSFIIIGFIFSKVKKRSDKRRISLGLEVAATEAEEPTTNE